MEVYAAPLRRASPCRSCPGTRGAAATPGTGSAPSSAPGARAPAGMSDARPARCPCAGADGMASTSAPAGSAGPSAVQVQPTGDLRDRHPLAERQPANLLPLLLTDHRHLLGWGDLRSDRPGLALDLPRHFAPSSRRRGEHFSLPVAKHYWLPDDTPARG